MRLSDEYIAGFFDGEGSIYISNLTLGYSLRVQIGQNDIRPLKCIQRKFGGGIYSNGKKSKGYTLTLCGNSTIPLLKAIKPFVLVKRKQVFLALRHLKTLRPHPGWKGKPLTRYEKKARLECRKKMRLLNGR